MNFTLGLIISISLLLISFEWTRPVNIRKDLAAVPDITAEVDLIEVIPREKKKPEVRKQPEVKKVIVPVDDNIELPPIEWEDTEVTRRTVVDLYDDDEPETGLAPEPDFVYVAEEPATFNGGAAVTEFGKYIYKQLRYPEEAVQNGVDGLVVLIFDINKQGELVNARVLSGVHPSLDNEALRVVRSSPKWKPARQNGKTVVMRFTFPVRFVLQ